MSMFPKELPRASLRKKIAMERKKRGMKKIDNDSNDTDETPPSFKDMIKSFKRLLTNATYMLNNIAGIFYFFGQANFFLFLIKV
jgi:Organic Anion Transporter Polypeptide (OATP) family